MRSGRNDLESEQTGRPEHTEEIRMHDGNDLLSQVFPVENSKLEFFWYGWH
jgi:hypothetical protein